VKNKFVFAPRLRVEASRYEPVRSSYLTIDVTQRANERAISRMSVTIPSGYGLEPVGFGKRMGDASVALGQHGQRALLPPLTLAGDLRTAKRAGSACASNPIWVVKTVLKSSSESTKQIGLPLKVFFHKVDNVRRITICVPSTSHIAGNRVVRRVTLKIRVGLVPPGPGNAVWRGLFTPVASAAAALQGTTESRGIVPLPSFLTLQPLGSKRVVAGSVIRLNGVLSLNGPAERRAIRVTVASDRRGFLPVGETRTGGNGAFSFETKAPKRLGDLYFQARAPSHDVPCTGETPGAPAGCTSATVSGMTSTSVHITVTS
jgi:hypothetical protein